MELLRYDTMFTSHRQDVFNTLTNKVMLKGLLIWQRSIKQS